uniref:Uncharacterized protein n=1 Tax=Physcomitrium patens TaxID=3218 RepID=A0A2K1KHI9_PHYPA|nr:hypothetical protein PHYPA_009622 [Physcomitrium patens]
MSFNSPILLPRRCVCRVVCRLLAGDHHGSRRVIDADITRNLYPNSEETGNCWRQAHMCRMIGEVPVVQSARASSSVPLPSHQHRIWGSTCESQQGQTASHHRLQSINNRPCAD